MAQVLGPVLSTGNAWVEFQAPFGFGLAQQ